MSLAEFIPDVNFTLNIKNVCSRRWKNLSKIQQFYLHAEGWVTAAFSGLNSSSGSTSSIFFFFNISISDAEIRLVFYLNHSSEFAPMLNLSFWMFCKFSVKTIFLFSAEQNRGEKKREKHIKVDLLRVLRSFWCLNHNWNIIYNLKIQCTSKPKIKFWNRFLLDVPCTCYAFSDFHAWKNHQLFISVINS